jgi:hypothetical protein
MDKDTLRSRQKVSSTSSDTTPAQEKEKMLVKNRKPTTENYEFGDIQKIPPNIQDVMDKNFLRLFIWELYFGEILFR